MRVANVAASRLAHHRSSLPLYISHTAAMPTPHVAIARLMQGVHGGHSGQGHLTDSPAATRGSHSGHPACRYQHPIP